MILKRTFDIIVSILILIILSPLLLGISILIKLDSKGPMIFKQKRIGKNGKEFIIYKFRTMVKNAEKKGTKYRVTRNDERITKVGDFLRKTSLDELPQLFNVLLGDMSLVGPRPTLDFIVNEYDEYQKKRLEVKPGMTGLAQINGRQSLSWEEKIEYDIKYVENQSIWLDIKIIFKTFFVLFDFSETHKNKEIDDDEDPKSYFED